MRNTDDTNVWLATAKYQISDKTGCIELNTCNDTFCTLEYSYAYKGAHVQMIKGNARVQLYLYRPEYDDKYIYTYDYEPQESWTTYESAVTIDEEKREYIFEEEVYFRVAIISREAEDEANVYDFLQIEHGTCRENENQFLQNIFNEETQQVIARAQRIQKEDSLNLLLLTDSHYTVNGNWETTASNLKKMSEELPILDGIIHLGDLTDGMVPGNLTRGYVRRMQQDMRDTGLPLYQVIGNHDSNYFRKNPDRFVERDVIMTYLPGKSRLYYHEDFADNNIRGIFLDSFNPDREARYGFSDEELDWLERTLKDTPADYGVVVFSHVPPIPRLHYWSDEIHNSRRLMNILGRFQHESQGSLLAYIHGHNHADQVDYEEGFPIISIGCSKVEYFEDKKPAGAYTPPRSMGKKNQELWDVLSISRQNRTIDFTRFGAGEDRHIDMAKVQSQTGEYRYMKKVITYGTFDLFHEGHYNLLKRAKALGDYLIVGVTTEHFDEQRGKINVIDSLLERIENVRKTGFADEIIIEDHEGQKIEDIKKYQADIFTLGSDWVGVYDYLSTFCEVVYLDRTPDISSTMLRKEKFPIVRVGVVGTGRIAPRFISEAKYVSGISIRGVYNPNAVSTKEFEQAHEVQGFSEDFSDFLDVVDAIYIASPHETHYEYAREALLAGRHVLCEKPLAFSKQQAQDLFAIAKEKKLVLMEGIKTAYCPGFAELLNVAQGGKIGEIRDVEACFSRLTSEKLRERQDTEYGGAFLEFGNYTLLPIVKLLGLDYEKVQIDSILAENGVDLYTKIQFRYKDGLATSKTGIGVKSEGQLLIAGTKGYILAEAPWWLTKKFEIHYEDPNKIERFTPNFMGDGLRYEISEFVNKINGHSGHGYKLTAEESITMAQIVEDFMNRRAAYYSQRKEEDKKSGVHIWAHRGCSHAYPENTLEAFEAACKLPGISGIELDIQLSQDGQMVVYHDETLDRLMNQNGKVVDFTLEELKNMHFKDWKNKETHMTIPTMEEVLQLVKPYAKRDGIKINIELKNGRTRYDGMEQMILDLVKKCEMEEYIIYSSFNQESLKLLKSLDETVQTGILQREVTDCLNIQKKLGVEAIHPNVNTVTDKEQLPEHMPVRVWNSEEAFYAQHRYSKHYNLTDLGQLGVTDFITNIPEEYL